jgi:hypothetical protein
MTAMGCLPKSLISDNRVGTGGGHAWFTPFAHSANCTMLWVDCGSRLVDPALRLLRGTISTNITGTNIVVSNFYAFRGLPSTNIKSFYRVLQLP